MSLEKITYHSLDYIPSALVRQIEQKIKNHKRLEIVVPSMSHVGCVQKQLAVSEIARGGVSVHTFLQYVTSLWNLVTDGRQIAQKSRIEAMATSVLDNAPKDLSKASVIADILSQASDKLGATFSTIEDKNCQEIVEKAQELLELLHEAGYITQKEAMNAIIASEQEFTLVAFLGFEQGDTNFISFIKDLSKKTLVFYVVPETEAGKMLASALPGEIKEFEVKEDLGGKELEQLRQAVFLESDEKLSTPPLDMEAQLIFLEPLGPSAEAESIARLIEQCENAENVLVTTTDPEKMWRTLAPKLVPKMTVHATWTKPLLQVKPVALFLNFVAQMWELLEDQKKWKAFADKWQSLADKSLLNAEVIQQISQDYAALPNNWWPPKAIIDFLHSSCSPFGAYGAKDIDNFDIFIRSHRDITPEILLKRLNIISDENNERAKDAQVLFNIIKNRIIAYDFKGAIEAVLQVAFDDRSQETQRGITKLFSLILEIEAQNGNPALIEDEELRKKAAQNQYASLVALARTVTLNYSFQANDIKDYKKTSVDIVSYSGAKSIRPRSYSLCVLANQSMEAQSTRMYEISGERLIANKLGNKKIVSHEIEVQAQNVRFLAIGREQVAFEKAQRTSEGREIFPSPLWGAVETHFKKEDLIKYKYELKKHLGDFVQQNEEKVWQNYSSQDEQTDPKKIPLERDILLTNRAKEIIGYTIEKNDKEDKHVLSEGIRLSPTSLEELRACPRKWFFTRGLPTIEQDAVFAASSKGTLYHDVLRRYLSTKNANEKALDEIWSSNFAKAFAHAGGVDLKLSAEAKRELAPFLEAIPKRLQEIQEVNDMADNLKRLVKNGTILIEGFKPKLYEYEFGPEIVKYAGVGQKGSIDRIDIDDKGNILIIDYKSSKEKTLEEYAVNPTEKAIRHPQTFMYARIVESLTDKIKQDLCLSEKIDSYQVVGVLYLGVADCQAYFGYISDEELAKSIKSKVQGCTVRNCKNFNSFVEKIEDEMSTLVKNELSQGLLPARPLDDDKNICKYCNFKYKCSYDMRKKRAEVEKRDLWSQLCQR